MKFHQIRNATAIIHYAGKKILIDPMLSAKGSFPGFPLTMNRHLRNPLVDLPLPVSEVIDVGNDSNLLIVFYVQIMPDDFVMQLHRF